MTINTNFTEVEFEATKTKLIEFLKSKPEFQDYDFTGSRLNILIDVLAYATIYMGAYANFAFFESFLEKAQLRENIVTAAQSNGYIPSSKRASTIEVTVTLTFTGGGPAPSFVTIPRGFSFSGSGNSTYPFIVTTDVEVIGSSGVYTTALTIAQGKLLKNQYTWANGSRIFIKDQNIDRRYNVIKVNGTEWIKAENAARVDATSQVYYLRETVEGWTEIYFGAGEFETIEDQIDLSSYVGGLKPSVGDIITVEYLVTKGSEANFISDIKVTDDITNYEIEVTVAADEVSAGGGDKEDKERIRLVASKMNQVQNRCVVADDYDAKILEAFGSTVEAVRTWYDEDKPKSAFIAIKPVDSLQLTNSQADTIKAYLKKYNVGPITPRIVTPAYVFINHTIEVDYDINKLSISESQLKQKIITAMDEYYTSNVKSFSDSFHVSKLLPYIDDVDTSILGSSDVIGIVKEYNVPKFFDLNTDIWMGDTNLPLRAISTSAFTFNEINNNTIVRTFNLHLETTDSGFVVIGPFPVASEAYIGELYNVNDFDGYNSSPTGNWYKIGTVDYTAGTFILDDFDDISINRFTEESIVDDTIKFKSSIDQFDIYTQEGELIIFEPDLRPEYINITFNPITK